MNIGIIGCGVVGTALKNGFRFLEHEVSIADPKFGTSTLDVCHTEIVFICVPTNCNLNGSCDLSIVKRVLQHLRAYRYNGIVVLKSTVVPGTTEKLSKEFNREIVFVPEFLHERYATEDFIYHQDILVIGTDDKELRKVVANIHKDLPKRVVTCSKTEAELVKYFNNVYNATLITFANSFYEVCVGLGVNYDNVKSIVTLRDHINDVYLDCNNSLRGFGGPCLPKDTKALAFLAEQLNTDVKFFDMLLSENVKYETTVLKGMRS